MNENVSFVTFASIVYFVISVERKATLGDFFGLMSLRGRRRGTKQSQYCNDATVEIAAAGCASFAMTVGVVVQCCALSVLDALGSSDIVNI